MIYHIATRSESLDTNLIRHVDHAEYFKEKGSHVVSEITYGANSNFVFELEQSEGEDLMTARASVEGLISKFKVPILPTFH